MAAAHTFFLANPDHVEMKQNLDYYKMMAGVREEDFKDLEARPHMVRTTPPSPANHISLRKGKSVALMFALII